MPLRRALPILLLSFCFALTALPATALDVLYMVRHAEKVDDWPEAPELDAFRPLAPAGVARAEALAVRLKDEGIAAVYTSRTTRAIATAEPLAKAGHRPLLADEASRQPEKMAGFLASLRQKHAGDRAVLVVGHADTLPALLAKLGAQPECFERLRIFGPPERLMADGYDGIWRVDLRKQGCEAIERSSFGAGPKP